MIFFKCDQVLVNFLPRDKNIVHERKLLRKLSVRIKLTATFSLARTFCQPELSASKNLLPAIRIRAGESFAFYRTMLQLTELSTVEHLSRHKPAFIPSWSWPPTQHCSDLNLIQSTMKSELVCCRD